MIFMDLILLIEVYLTGSSAVWFLVVSGSTVDLLHAQIRHGDITVRV